MSLRLLFFSLVLCSGQNAWSQYIKSDANHEIKIFNQGAASFDQRLRMIERATKSIDVEYFLYDNKDMSSRLFSQALVRKARQGVAVRVLVDSFVITVKLDKYIAAEFEKNNVTVRYFNKAFALTPTGHHRNHRKHLIVETNGGLEVISGGRNIEDKYFDFDPRYNFLDRDVWIKGPIVASIKESFEQIWGDGLTRKREKVRLPQKIPQVNGRGMDEPRYASDWRRHNEDLYRAYDFLNPTAKDVQDLARVKAWAAPQWKNVGIFSGAVSYISDKSRGKFSWFTGKKKERLIWDRIRLILNDTEEQLLAESPYLILTKEGFAEVESLRGRRDRDGNPIPVAVEALTNSPFSTDSKLTSTTYYGLSKKIAASGAIVKVYDGVIPELYRRSTPSISRNAKWGVHAKTMVFDNINTAIGSFNLDPLSKDINVEAAIFFPNNEKIASFVTDDIRMRQNHSFEFFQHNPDTGELTKRFSDCKDMSFYQCFMFRIQRPLARIFIGLL